LHNGFDPRTKKQIGLKTGKPEDFKSFDELFNAYQRQLNHFLEIKLKGNHLIERLYATEMPAPFLSVLIDDCIKKGMDYNAGGARYNNNYIQMVGLGSITDSLSAIKDIVFEKRKLTLSALVNILDRDFQEAEEVRQWLLNRTHKYGNDDDYADSIMRMVFNACFEYLDGKPNAKGGCYRVEMLPTTCHIYFGKVTGALPDGRKATLPLSEGISPVQGADRNGPTAVFKSAAKLDHIKTGGALLNMKFSPDLLKTEEGIDKLAQMIRAYFRMDGHHVQFNVVTRETLKKAQQNPEQYRDLIVRVAGYSDYFCDLAKDLQEEIISRTEHQKF
ncbi:MAG: pyruvate formate lyase family protein, partial [Limisphaerales bacterium]